MHASFTGRGRRESPGQGENTRLISAICAVSVKPGVGHLAVGAGAAIRKGVVAGNPLPQDRLDKPVRAAPGHLDRGAHSRPAAGQHPPAGRGLELRRLIIFPTQVENDPGRRAVASGRAARPARRRGAALDRDDPESDARRSPRARPPPRPSAVPATARAMDRRSHDRHARGGQPTRVHACGRHSELPLPGEAGQRTAIVA